MPCAIILAGGQGQRLQPHTTDKPKCMVSLLGNPLVSYQMNLLSLYGFRKVIICCGFKHEVLQAYLGDGSSHNIQVDYLVEDRPLGRGGALKSALKRLDANNEPVLALNGDIVTNVNLTELVDFHKRTKAMATILSVPLKSPYGILACNEGSFATSFREKPELPYWINGGVYVLNREVLDSLPDQGDHEDSTFPRLASEGTLAVFKSRAFWQPVDTVKDLNDVRDYMQKFIMSTFFQQPQALVAG